MGRLAADRIAFSSLVGYLVGGTFPGISYCCHIAIGCGPVGLVAEFRSLTHNDGDSGLIGCHDRVDGHQFGRRPPVAHCRLVAEPCHDFGFGSQSGRRPALPRRRDHSDAGPRLDVRHRHPGHCHRLPSPDRRPASLERAFPIARLSGRVVGGRPGPDADRPGLGARPAPALDLPGSRTGSDRRGLDDPPVGRLHGLPRHRPDLARPVALAGGRSRRGPQRGRPSLLSPRRRLALGRGRPRTGLAVVDALEPDQPGSCSRRQIGFPRRRTGRFDDALAGRRLGLRRSVRRLDGTSGAVRPGRRRHGTVRPDRPVGVVLAPPDRHPRAGLAVPGPGAGGLAGGHDRAAADHNDRSGHLAELPDDRLIHGHAGHAGTSHRSALPPAAALAGGRLVSRPKRRRRNGRPTSRRSRPRRRNQPSGRSAGLVGASRSGRWRRSGRDK